jgi:hypothetical protein
MTALDSSPGVLGTFEAGMLRDVLASKSVAVMLHTFVHSGPTSIPTDTRSNFPEQTNNSTPFYAYPTPRERQRRLWT